MNTGTSPHAEVGLQQRVDSENSILGFSENSDVAVRQFPNPKDFLDRVLKKISAEPAM